MSISLAIETAQVPDKPSAPLTSFAPDILTI